MCLGNDRVAGILYLVRSRTLPGVFALWSCFYSSAHPKRKPSNKIRYPKKLHYLQPTFPHIDYLPPAPSTAATATAAVIWGCTTAIRAVIAGPPSRVHSKSAELIHISTAGARADRYSCARTHGRAQAIGTRTRAAAATSVV